MSPQGMTLGDNVKGYEWGAETQFWILMAMMALKRNLKPKRKEEDGEQGGASKRPARSRR